ncbi:Rha family transcriptional regulator [Pleomorphomonas diazotrophica]|nr:Rha family transcriptional regulator [Pleomorphomonas diazotrophica]
MKPQSKSAGMHLVGAFKMDGDGFTLLAMGFTGRTAL